MAFADSLPDHSDNPLRFAFLADLHLSERGDTAAAAVLAWAADRLRRPGLDFAVLAGDMTSYGSATAAARLLQATAPLPVPVYHTPGNAERRGPGALPALGAHLDPERRWAVHGDLLVLLPDTSTGDLPAAERAWLEQVVSRHPARRRRAVLTHYPLDKLRAASAAWLEQWLAAAGVELLVAGHSHLQRQRRLGGCLEVVVRGLDPDKAIGGLPGFSILESPGPGQWREELVPWSPTLELAPSDLPDGRSPVGWSIHGEPVAAAGEALEQGLSCLELRPREAAYPRAALAAALDRLRQRAPLYLSYHLPNLAWDPETERIEGEEDFRAHLENALAAGVDSLTVHVPVVPARLMGPGPGGGSGALHDEFAEISARLLGPAAAAGRRLAVENLHNPAHTPLDSPDLQFGTRLEQQEGWIAELARRLPGATVGALLDVGHARNNGGELENLQPLGDWYAAVGRQVLGYHIHQVRPDPDTGRLVNHRQIDGLFGPRISFAGFLWAWSRHQLARAPLFIEVRDPEERRATARLLQGLFARAGQIEAAADLPGAG